jgi:hypothetical protein
LKEVTPSIGLVDAKRFAFGYTISGLPDTPEAITLSSNIVMKDQQDNLIVGSGKFKFDVMEGMVQFNLSYTDI